MAAISHENSPNSNLGPYTQTPAPSKNSTFFPFANAYSRFASWRAALGLPNPGAVENLQKEVKSELFAIIFKGRPDVTCAVTQQHT